MLFFVCFHCIKQYKKAKKIWHYTLRGGGGILLVNLLGYNLKSGGLHFWKAFYHLIILGWASGFRTIDDLPSAHWDETEFKKKIQLQVISNASALDERDELQIVETDGTSKARFISALIMIIRIPMRTQTDISWISMCVRKI